MKRMKVLFGQRRIMVLATLAILVLTAAALVASSASFTATSANPGNAFSSGTLTMSNSQAGPIVQFTTTKMRPGDVATGTVQIGNSGDVPGAFTLTKSVVTGSNAALAAKLDLVIDEMTDNTYGIVDHNVFNGKLDGAISKVSLGTWDGGENHYYKFTVTWDNGNSPAQDAADTLLMGKTATYDFTWDAVANSTIN